MAKIIQLYPDLPSPTPSEIDPMLAHEPTVARFFGRNHDHLIVPVTYDDLGARIVAKALAKHMADRSARLAEHFPVLSAMAGDAEGDLNEFADGSDPAAVEYSRECWNRYDFGWGRSRDGL